MGCYAIGLIWTCTSTHTMFPPRFKARAAGSAAIVLSREGTYITVKMPSSEVRLIPQDCWCTIGKAGTKRFSMGQKTVCLQLKVLFT